MSTAEVEKILVTVFPWALGRGSFRHFMVATRTTNSEPWKLCRGYYSMEGSYNPHEITCHKPTIARYIKLSVAHGDGLYLNEVRVVGTAV